MKYFFYLFIILIFTQTSVFAIEEVILDIDDNNLPDVIQKESADDNKYTLYEKIQNIKSREITATNSSSYLLDEILQFYVLSQFL